LQFFSDFWTEFEVGEITISLHGGATKKVGPEKGDVEDCTLGFYVDNVNEVYEILSEKGVKYIQFPERKENESIIFIHLY
jgi:hypothetical protein